MVSAAPAASGANLTAAMCRKRNRVARVLAYALLEWILIALLLANGVFSYLISKFAAFFGLAPPCALCSRLGVDSLFEPHHRGAGVEPLRRVLCDAHAAEMSRLGYCAAHRRLADAADMCEDCGAAVAAPSGKALLSWMRRSELGERDLACACCGVALESGFYSPAFLLPRPAARGLDCGYKEGAIASLNEDVVFVSEDGPVIEFFDEKPLLEDDSVGVIAAQCADIVGNVERLVPLESIDALTVGMYVVSSQSVGEGKEAIDHGTLERDYETINEVNANELKFSVASVDQLIDEEIDALVASTDSTEDGSNSGIKSEETAERLSDQQSPREYNGLKEKDQGISTGYERVEQGTVKQGLFSSQADHREHEFMVDKSDENTQEEMVQKAEINNEWDPMPIEAVARVCDTSDENSEEKHVQQAELNQEFNSVPVHHADEEFEENTIARDELKQELDAVAIYSWEQVHVTSDENTQEKHVEQAELKPASIFISAGLLEYVADSFSVNTNTGKDDIEVDPTEPHISKLYQLPSAPSISLDRSSPDCDENKDKRVPDTPTYLEGISYLQELADPKAMTSDTKSVDSSIASISTDLESAEVVTVDQLKSALEAARKSLSTLYAELENERSASAIAADETMAMINRLQEQKAAMQMEAMQYQRLMEEQSEYDQEALQRLNELIVKRDKEKQDMERELELYRHKVHLYEAKERRKMSRHKADDRNGSSSASSSAEDSDDLSQSFYEGDESAHGLNGSNGSIPTDLVLQETARHIVTLDGSLADCEEERLSILEQLKVLEERLFDLEDEECDNMKVDKHLSEDNHLSGGSYGSSDDDISFKLHDKRKGVSCRGKKLLPLLDDAAVENGNGLLTMQDTEGDPSAEVVLELAKEQDKLAIASEIDQVHERLHALEADKEFIKQCVRSLNKGGKGFVLLQEILQHLRDLRRIEQRARNSGELSLHYVHPYTDKEVWLVTRRRCSSWRSHSSIVGSALPSESRSSCNPVSQGPRFL